VKDTEYPGEMWLDATASARLVSLKWEFCAAGNVGRAGISYNYSWFTGICYYRAVTFARLGRGVFVILSNLSYISQFPNLDGLFDILC
jgi:hypothetical protein